MIKTSLKLTAVAAMLAGASVGANAATTDLGTISVGQPTTFSGVVKDPVQVLTISSPLPWTAEIRFGYSVVNIPLSFTGGNGTPRWPR